MKKIAIALCLFLGGCVTNYVPNILDITPDTASIAAADVVTCTQYAEKYKRPFNPVVAGATAGQGFAGNLSSAAISTAGWWMGPLLGGGGGLLNYIAQWIGLIDTDTPRAEQQCIRQRLDRDHAGILVEPPL